jgi:hypothetical protein
MWVSPDGAQILYRMRRFLPNPSSMQVLTEVTVKDGERIDQLAFAQLGSSLQWWRIADANGAVDPYALTEQPGVRLIVPVPTT